MLTGLEKVLAIQTETAWELVSDSPTVMVMVMESGFQTERVWAMVLVKVPSLAMVLVIRTGTA